VSGST